MRSVQVVLFLAVAGGSIACSIDVRGNQASAREEKRFTVSATDPVDLTIRTFDGVIVVRSWDRDEVLVEVERRAADQSSAEALVVEQTQEGNRIVVEAPGERNRNTVSFGTSRSVNFTVTAPRRMTLEARTGDGLIETRDLQGAVDLNSGDGRIIATNIEGRLKAHTGDGSIDVDQVVGAVDADSGDGSIGITGRLDELLVRTGDGPVNVQAADGSNMKTDWRITTGDGRIALRVPNAFNAAVDASTGDGSVRVEGISAPPANADDSERRRVVGQLGSGGLTLHLRSADGSIEVSR
jgi:DUF4097 and DUF4098 domain-containing protein YvlB